MKFNAERVSEPDSSLLRVPPAAYVLTCCIGVIGANSFVLAPIAPEVARSLGTAVPEVMLAAAVYGLGAALSALLLAHYIDRLGAHTALRVAMVLLPIALLLCACSPHVNVLIGAQLAAGVISGVALPAIYASASWIAPPGHESKTLSVVLTGWMLSLVAGVSLSALLAAVVGWRAVYFVVALMAIVAAMSLSKIHRRPSRSSLPTSLPISALRLPGIMPLLLSCAASMTAFYGVYSYLGDYVHRGLALPISINGLTALAYGAGFGTAVFFDNAVVRVGPRRALPLALTSIAATYFLLAVCSSTLAGLLILLVILGLLNHLVINLFIIRLTAIDPSKRGSITGLYSAVSNLSVFAGTSAFGPVYVDHGFAATAYGAVALTAIGAVAALASSVPSRA